MKKILLPIDRSTTSQKSFGIAKEFAEKLGAKLVIVQVIEMHQKMHNVGYATKLLPDSEFL
ncbi:Universal stress protein family protein, partial [Desulfonispora thiosulfatigenes DSM 11270]